ARTSACAFATTAAVLCGASGVTAATGLALEESCSTPPSRSATAVIPAAAAPKVNLFPFTLSPSAGAEGPAGCAGPLHRLASTDGPLRDLVALVRGRDVRERPRERHVVGVDAVPDEIVRALVGEPEGAGQDRPVALSDRAELDVDHVVGEAAS